MCTFANLVVRIFTSAQRYYFVSSVYLHSWSRDLSRFSCCWGWEGGWPRVSVMYFRVCNPAGGGGKRWVGVGGGGGCVLSGRGAAA